MNESAVEVSVGDYLSEVGKMSSFQDAKKILKVKSSGGEWKKLDNN